MSENKRSLDVPWIIPQENYDTNYFDQFRKPVEEIPMRNPEAYNPSQETPTDFTQYLDQLVNGLRTDTPVIPYTVEQNISPLARPEDLNRYKQQELASKRINDIVNLPTTISQPIIPNIQPKVETIISSNINQDTNNKKQINTPINPPKTSPIVKSSIVPEIKPEVKKEESFTLPKTEKKERSFEDILADMKKEEKIANDKENEIFENARKTSVLTNLMGDIRGGLEKISAGMARVEGDPNAGKSLKKDAENMMNTALKQIEMSKEQRKNTKNLVKDAISEITLRGEAAKLDPNSDYSKLQQQLFQMTSSENIKKYNLTPEVIRNMTPDQIKNVQEAFKNKDANALKLELQQMKNIQDQNNKEFQYQFKKSELERKDEYLKLAQQRFEDAKVRDKEKVGKLSDKQLENVNEFDAALAQLEVLKERTKNKKLLESTLGPLDIGDGTIGKIIRGPEEIAFRSEIGKISDNYRKLITGAAAADKELLRIEARLPQATNDPEQFKALFNSFEKQLRKSKDVYLNNLQNQGRRTEKYETPSSQSISQTPDWQRVKLKDGRIGKWNSKTGEFIKD